MAVGNYPSAPAPDDFDVTITSTTDDEATVRAAVGLDDPAAEDTEEASTEDSAADESAVAEGDEAAESAEGDDETPDDDEARDAAQDAKDEKDTKRLAADAGADYEPPVKGETPEQADARRERNIDRIQKLVVKVANRDQHINALRDQIKALRDRLDAREEPNTRGTRTEAPADAEEVPDKFTFPSWEEWAGQAGNEEKTHEDWENAKLDAHYEHRQRLESQREARLQRRRDTEAVLAANQSRIEAFRDVVPDYDEAVSASTAPMTPTMHLTMLQREWGPAFAYWASTTPEGKAEATRIAKLAPLDQVEALIDTARTKPMQELIAKVKGTKSPATTTDERTPKGRTRDERDAEDVIPSRRTSNAPAPARRVAGSARTERNLEDLDTDEFIAAMDRRDRERGRLR